MFLMEAGEIKDNKALETGGGIYGSGSPAVEFRTSSDSFAGPVTICDNYVENEGSRLSDNLYLPKNRTVNVSSIKEGSKIGIRTEILPTEVTPRVLMANVPLQIFLWIIFAVIKQDIRWR